MLPFQLSIEGESWSFHKADSYRLLQIAGGLNRVFRNYIIFGWTAEIVRFWSLNPSWGDPGSRGAAAHCVVSPVLQGGIYYW